MDATVGTAIVAAFFSLMIQGQEWPELVGPYDEPAECEEVLEIFRVAGHETDGCYPLPVPQENAIRYDRPRDVAHNQQEDAP